MVVAHLDDQLGFERHPFGGTLGAPAAWPAWCVAGEARLAFELFELLCQRGAIFICEAGGEADMVELARVIVETEQQRADELAAGRISESADDAIGAAQMFQLQHRALTRQIRRIELLGDDTVEGPARMRQPGFGGFAIARVIGQTQRRRLANTGIELLERVATLRQRLIEKNAGLLGIETIKKDEDRRRLGREFSYPAFGGMQPKLQRIEGQAIADRDRELAVEHEASRRQRL